MPPTTAATGRFVWYDLMTTDPGGAKSFYTSLIGWSITPFQTAPEPYDMWTMDAPVGGVMALPAEAKAAGAPPHWLGYVAVDDVDATVARAVELGAGTLVPGEDIPNVGRFAVLTDPQGAAFCIYHSTNPEWAPSAGAQGTGQVSWHELATTDYAGAFEFYQALFGWKITDDMDMGEAGVYRMFGMDDGVPMGGIFNKPAAMPQCAWLYYIKVPDVDAAAAKAKELGGQVVNGPMEVPGGDRIVQCLDPQGAMFALHSSKE